MGRVDDIFAQLREQRRGGLMPFICGGHPTPDSTAGLIRTLARAGADTIEIGIPFSDPIADGPIIAAAMHTALTQGVTPTRVFEQVASVRPHVDVGLIAMVSVSLVIGMGGPDRFVGMAREAGFDGFIFPDAPLEESGELVRAARDAGMTASLLIAPTTPPDRAAAIASMCSGFLYLLARSGITGERGDAPEIAERCAMLRRVTRIPIACGFGISTPEHVRLVLQHADAAIVGSALVRRLSEAAASGDDAASVAEAFTAELATAVHTI